MNAWDIFYKNIQINDFVKKNDKIVLAVSGGADSVSMAHLFSRLSKKISFESIIVNFNHNLRKNSHKDAICVKKLSDNLKIPFVFKNLQVKDYSQKEKVSIETAGRILRYSNLEAIAKKHHCNKIATAHNADDNAETVIMRLLRGSGTFLGIPQERKISDTLAVIRPLLCIKRSLIEDYAKNHNLKFLHDETNFLDIYTRNKIRLSVSPVFKKINPFFAEHIFSLSQIQAREDAYLEKLSLIYAKKCSTATKNKIKIDLKKFTKYDEAIKYRILKILIPEKKYSDNINLVMNKIKLKSKYEHILSAIWIFKVTKNFIAFCKVNQSQ
ncbi:MAG: tRNA lysidine(34) synthetase TilS [Elusimicrobiota bacterium]|jgi:tRNA(Ile)-lysidine synthase|nr:tRNA lysidine(34) synthetase TilS [Elusimicrobiota bacterium]